MDNQENSLERLIKKQLEEKMPSHNGPGLRLCPSELVLSDYLENRLGEQQQKQLLEHVADCPNCLALLELAQQSQQAQIKDQPSRAMIKRAQNALPEKQKQKNSSRKWSFLAALTFILSFIATRYFLQFLTLAVIFSIKWIFDSGSTRTLIMIYEAWRKKDKGSAHRIIKDFQDETEQRK